MRILVVVSLAVAASPAFAGKNKKNAEPAAPVVGWQPAGSAGGQCWHPPDFAKLPEGSKRMAWQETRDAIVSQWRGDRGDGVDFDHDLVEKVETVLLAQANRIEQVSKDNLAQCETAMKGGGTGPWGTWLRALPAQLTAGECP